MVEGKNEEMSTSELSGGARIHYIFQSIFVKSLEVSILDITFFHYIFRFILAQFHVNMDLLYWNLNQCKLSVLISTAPEGTHQM